MMDALNTLVKPAPETAAGAKSTKGDASVGNERFANELKGLGDQKGSGKGAARGEETKTATIADEAEANTTGPIKLPAKGFARLTEPTIASADSMVSTDETALAATMAKKTAPAVTSFAALTAGLRVATEPPLTNVELEFNTDPKAAGKTANKNTKTVTIGNPGKAKGADFSGLGSQIDGKNVVDGSAASEIVRKIKVAAQGDVDTTALTTETPDDEVTEAGADAGDQPDIQPEMLSDVLGLLMAGTTAVQVEGKASAGQGRNADVKSIAAKAPASETASHIDTMDGTDEAMDAMPSDEMQHDRVFRLVRGEGQGQSVGLKIASDSNGRLDVETRSGTGGQAETVNVVEARRYLGFNAPSNSSSLTAAIAGNDEWVSAMHPSARLANEAQQSSTGQVVNTLKLELNPISLGTVTAMLRLSGDELNVHLTVHTAAAYRELSNDSSSMMDALRSQGFSVDQVTVSMAPVAASQDAGDTSGRFSQQQQQQNMQQAAGEGSRNGDQGARQNARGGSDGQPGIAAGRIDESEQVSSVLRGSGGARPGHVYI